MPQSDPYRLFVTHVWQEDDDYFRVFEYLESNPNFYYRNYSRPHQRPEGGGEALRESLREQIRPVETVIVLPGLYAQHQDLIEFQVNAAQAMEKPVLVMEPFGAGEIPEWLKSRADETAEWDARSIEDAVRRTARQEDTSRWEVIEFDWPEENEDS